MWFVVSTPRHDPARLLLRSMTILWRVNYIRDVTQINSALHPSRVAKSSTSFSWGEGGKVASVGWQVTLCDPICHVISRTWDAELMSVSL